MTFFTKLQQITEDTLKDADFVQELSFQAQWMSDEELSYLHKQLLSINLSSFITEKEYQVACEALQQETAREKILLDELKQELVFEQGRGNSIGV